MTMKPLTKLNSFGSALVAIAIFAALPAMATEKKQKKPNVVFILADNVGLRRHGSVRWWRASWSADAEH